MKSHKKEIITVAILMAAAVVIFDRNPETGRQHSTKKMLPHLYSKDQG